MHTYHRFNQPKWVSMSLTVYLVSPYRESKKLSGPEYTVDYQRAHIL